MNILKNFKFFDYLLLLISSNIFSIIFLNDTSSFSLGLISIFSLFYCLNGYLFIFFILIETISSFLDFYGLTYDFLKLLFFNHNKLNTEFNFYIMSINFKYILYLILNLLVFLFLKIISQNINKLKNKSSHTVHILANLIFFLFILFLINFLYLSDPIRKSNLKKNLENNSYNNILRYDNWYIVLNSTISYKNTYQKNNNFNFSNLLKNQDIRGDIYLIINESYPNFKDNRIKKLLSDSLINGLDNFEILNIKKNWNKNYSTLGAEIELFCETDKNFKEFININEDFTFQTFLSNNDCWIKDFSKDLYKIYIHSYKGESFNRRNRYSARSDKIKKNFFDEIYFQEDLLKKKYKTCEKNQLFAGICEKEILEKLLTKIENLSQQKLIIYLTVENHIPLVIDDKIKNSACNVLPLKLNPQFCQIFMNQVNFNSALNKFIKNLDEDDILIFYSDTPPMFALRERVHFEDHIDLFFFKKN